MNSTMHCQVCGSDKWIALPDPHPSQSVTTAGRIVNQPLGKSQCVNCGLAQRVRVPFLGFTDYYEQDYANYYERPGTEKFHLNRYKVMIEWMNEFIVDGANAQNVLDVGCGQGWGMKVFSEKHPKTKIEGIEPSHYNVKKAREKTFTVYEGKLEEVALKKNHYDIVFSNNVIQHVNNAALFLNGLKELIKDDGVIAITCPDGSLPNIELLWSDQNFSFLPKHLISLAGKLNFKTIFWTSNNTNSALPPAQMLLLSNDSNYSNHKTDTTNLNLNIDLPTALKKRTDYLNSFSRLNTFIGEQTKNSSHIFNLGASYWTSVLAAYCPDYWKKVEKIVLNEPSEMDSFLGKPIIQYDSLKDNEKDTLVFGIAPASHTHVAEKFKIDWKKVVSWGNFINY